jgi:hypothetical protein
MLVAPKNNLVGQLVVGEQDNKKAARVAGGFREFFLVWNLERTLPFSRHWRWSAVIPGKKEGGRLIHGRIDTTRSRFMRLFQMQPGQTPSRALR